MSIWARYRSTNGLFTVIFTCRPISKPTIMSHRTKQASWQEYTFFWLYWGWARFEFWQANQEILLEIFNPWQWENYAVSKRWPHPTRTSRHLKYSYVHFVPTGTGLRPPDSLGTDSYRIKAGHVHGQLTVWKNILYLHLNASVQTNSHVHVTEHSSEQEHS